MQKRAGYDTPSERQGNKRNQLVNTPGQNNITDPEQGERRGEKAGGGIEPPQLLSNKNHADRGKRCR